jgi:hypothetical protein
MFANSAPQPVAHDGLADPARYRHSQPRSVVPRIFGGEQHEMRSLKSQAMTLNVHEFRAPPQAVGGRKTAALLCG